MAVVQTGDNKWAVARYIVDPTAGLGSFTTITAAMAAAASGDVIAVRQGTYTENFTIVPGVTLTTMGGSENGGVTVVGKVTMSGAGTSTIFGMRLQTNSDFAVVVSGSVASVLNIEGCFINCTNNTGISLTSSSADSQLYLFNCNGDITTTGIAYIAHSGAGAFTVSRCRFLNSGGTLTASTISSGVWNMGKSSFAGPVTISGTGQVGFTYVGMGSGNNTTITAGGAAGSFCHYCIINSGTASAASISTSLTMTNCIFNSSNTNVLTGAGTLSYAGLIFNGSSSNINVTTQTILNTGPSATFGSANSGGTNTLTVTNSSNTASSSANIVSTVGGSTAGDPTHQSVVSGVTTWTWGADNSVTSPTADPFVLAQGTALGTNNVMSVATSGEINYPLQPAFLAFQPSVATDVTGDGTVYTLGSTVDLTEVFDQNGDFDPTTGTFTAPVTGKYLLSGNARIIGGTAITTYIATLATSNRNLTDRIDMNAAAAFTLYSSCNTCLVDMDAADTYTYTVQTTDTGGKVDDVTGAAAETRTFMSGYLAC